MSQSRPYYYNTAEINGQRISTLKRVFFAANIFAQDCK